MPTFSNYNGYVAVDFGSATNPSIPIRERLVLVSDIDISNWLGLVGKEASYHAGVIWIWSVKWWDFKVKDWKKVLFVTPVSRPKPQEGHIWVWDNLVWTLVKKPEKCGFCGGTGKGPVNQALGLPANDCTVCRGTGIRMEVHYEG